MKINTFLLTMKNITYLSRQHVFRWLLLCWLLVPWGLQAQSSTHVTWDSQVGCQVHRGEKGNGDNSVAAASVETGTCIRVCENTNVTYTVHGSNILNVQWTSAGGTVQSVSGASNTQAVIAWGAAGGGFVHAVIQFFDGTTETQNICIEKINKPIPNFTVLNMKDRVCKNTEVHFENLSQANGGSDIVNYFWDFGDGTTSTAFEPNHTYTSAAGLTVSLTVTNKCGCSETVSQKLEILEAPPVQINCASVVCEGSVEKYSVLNGCKGDWKVIGGTLLNNYGNEIEVRWDQVDPEDGFGYVMYKSECGCPEWTTVKIPVILKASKIKGQNVVCTGRQYTYSLPQWPTTSFDWDVTGPGVGELTYNQQRNEILFKATVPGTYTLTSKYFNTLMLCGGEATKKIVVEQPVTISGGTPEICVGTAQTFTATPNVPVIWNVTLDGGVVYTSPQPISVPFSYNFATPGTYIVTAVKAGGGCESQGILVNVVAPPKPPRGPIVGDDVVCTGRPYVYSIGLTPANVIPVWTVTNGTIMGSNAGNSITVVFDTGMPTFSVSVRYRTIGQAGCLSTAITKNIRAIDLNKVSIVQNMGPFCPSSTQNFSAVLGNIVPDSMEWSFDQPNFGSFSSGQGTANIVVNINEVSGGVYDTNLNLKIVKCGQVKIISMPIKKMALPVINFTNVGKICPGSNLNFTIDQGGITTATSVTFTFANGSHTENFNQLGTYNFPNNGYIQNNTGGNVSQVVTVTINGANSCSYKPTASANFIILPETIITVSPVYNLQVCDSQPLAPYTLTANSSTGLTNILEWQWYKDGLPLNGFTTNSYTLSGVGLAGTYQVRAKDINGCYVYSQEIKVTNACPTGNNCTTPPTVYFAAEWTDCNKITVNSFSVNNAPDQIEWVSNNILTITNGQGTTSPEFQTNLAGAHIVSVRLRYGTCWYSKSIEVRKHYEPKFEIAQTCNGNGYNVTLYNTSTIFDINPNAIVYKFSSPGLPTQTGQTATYNNLPPGTYTFTMSMFAPSYLYPPCTITKTITLAPTPSTDFLLPAIACKGEAINLSPVSYTSGNTYTWYFDGTAFITSQPGSVVTFNTTGTKTVKLEVRTPQGCVYTSATVNIMVKDANFTGNVLPLSAVACEGSAPVVSFSPIGTAPSGYIWMNGSQQVPGAPNSMSFVPTQSGSYWPVLISPEGCRSNIMSEKAVPITIKKPPYVSISGQTNICSGSSAILNGIVTANNLEYRWKKNGAPIGTLWSNTFPIVFSTGALSAGTYTFTLEVRNPGTTDCTSSKDFIVTVSNPPAQPTITYTQIECTPYKVKLTASGPANGEYNWSNGMTGQSIVVGEGGVYKVIYTAPTGCKTDNEIAVPLSIESLMWVFPTGCYDYCRDKQRYVLGPKGTFDYHQWELFGTSLQNGTNDIIYPFYYVSSAGTYRLKIEQNMPSGQKCEFYSGPLNYYPGKDCGVETQCDVDVKIEAFKWDGDHYNVHGMIYNNGGMPIMLNISSLNGYGTYFPSMITIPAGGTYDMNSNPLMFYPNANFPGGTDAILFMGQEDCKFVAEPQIIGKPSIANAGKPSLTTASSLKLMPNPAKDIVKVSYNTGNEKLPATQIKVFDTMGNVKFHKELKSSSGEVNVDVSNWLQSTYIVIVQAGEKSLQSKLIKN
ncbi:Microbial collagenase precursor [Chryseobacterium nakagawai]|uniref:PKD domain-containing protein n=2 Tax=Chryseobacterium nakagawai TaxID=1241982 RepID=A0AAD0YJX4_CHRNA|nr:PKD domain-containing protein [Chryseobacterium nakagawai]AZA90267.1 PKD domain-containing protein [Chryseobacterium nakagawai]VEH21742.1 Microbial collagenase precursor [Chryseobacterium nakagawai]